MYPREFHYHRAQSLAEAASLLAELGTEARALAGGQSLLPLMKLRLSNPSHLVDISRVPGLAQTQHESGAWRLGAMLRHAQVESSPAAAAIPILHDCAAGIADTQVRNLGTLGGSLAEADPSGDWAPVMITLGARVVIAGPNGERTVAISDFITDAFTTVLAPGELIREVMVPAPAPASGGAYVAWKRCAPVYSSAGVALEITLGAGGACGNAAVALAAVGLTPVVVRDAPAILQGKTIGEAEKNQLAEAAAAAADPQNDMRGSAGYKRQLIRSLAREALEVALRRCRGESVEISHHYA